LRTQVQTQDAFMPAIQPSAHGPMSGGYDDIWTICANGKNTTGVATP